MKRTQVEDGTLLTKRFDDAFAYAAELHREQKRKGTDIPYVSHLLSVAALVLEHGGDEDEAIAALLHDAAEDQGGQEALNQIRQRFGPAVADIVAACSDTFETPKPPWTERKEAYIAHVRAASPSTRLVSAADKLHNARTILADLRTHGPDVWRRFTVGDPEQILWYYESLLDAFAGQTAPHPGSAEKPGAFDALVRELGFVVRAIRDEATAAPAS
ncbi:MAG TPA: HD domain-containing protein [Dehalococcoidia bacterium]|nr:HD domain-containing protein [Dehalococcoidia bacterium]